MNTVVCLLLATAITIVWGMKVIPERAKIVYYNKTYGDNVKFYVNRFSRKGSYLINLEGTIYDTWANNITVHFIFYEFLHNEYKRSFVELHYKTCDLVNSDPYIGQALKNVGIVCPVPPGSYKLNNITVPADDFPNVVPFHKCKVDIKVFQQPTEDLVLNVELFIQFKQ